ncbi:MAG TPA: hypothetical protein VND93_10195, partial [Myxococcales bacterium]|nr:hypothetical protein [Myxococcales bacterium]
MRSLWLAFLVSLSAFAQSTAPAPAPASTPAPAPAPAAPTPPAPPPTPSDVDRQRTVQVSTLKLLREKNVITEEEYQAALKDLGELGARAKDANTFVVGKLSTTVYGFVQVDYLYN